MICKRIIGAGILMSLLSLPLRSEVIIQTSENAVSITSTTAGTAGYHGCDVRIAEKVPAYIFELQTHHSQKSHAVSGCDGSSSSWVTIDKKESPDADVSFENLPDGKYRVVVLAGQAIGCELVGDVGELPNQSIVYQKEISKMARLDRMTLRSIPAFGTTESDILDVFPNPVRNELTIELQNTALKEKVIISLVDLLGQTVYVVNHPLDQNSANYSWKVNVQGYPPGAYFIKLQDPSGQQLSKKIIIQNNQ